MNLSTSRLFLLPLSWLYGMVVGVRNLFFNLGILRQERFHVGIVVVGNLSVGGTGKTPHVIALAKILSKTKRVAILTRGYKRQSKGFRWAEAEDAVKMTGDEALEMKGRLNNIAIATDGNRRRGIQRILDESNPKPEIIILDDGFQHRYVKADFNLLLTKHDQLYSEDYLLPAGNLREPRKAANRAHAICVTGHTADTELHNLSTILMASKSQYIIHSKPQYRHVPDNILDPSSEALLITSIANPGAVKEYLSSYCEKVHHLKFKDHHPYNAIDLQKIIRTFSSLSATNKVVVSTGKDIVKLKEFSEFSDLPYVVLEIDIEFSKAGEDKLIKDILSHVGED